MDHGEEGQSIETESSIVRSLEFAPTVSHTVLAVTGGHQLFNHLAQAVVDSSISCPWPQVPQKLCVFPRSSRGTIDGRPCAHWNGNTHSESFKTRSSHSCLVSSSLNIIAPAGVSHTPNCEPT